MKKIKYIIIIFLLAFIPNYYVKAISATVNVDDTLTFRSDTNIYSNILGYIPANTKLDGIVNSNKKGNGCVSNWYLVTYNNQQGYVCSDYLIIDETTSDKGRVSCVENDDPLNIWSDINKTSRLKQLSCDTEMNILKRNVASNEKCANWYQVEHDSTIGYACGTYIYSDSDTNITTNKNVGKSTTGDNIYKKENYSTAVSGDGTISCFEDTGDLSLRSTPGGSTTGKKISCGVSVKINDSKESSGLCKYYYNITNLETNDSGWVCSYYVNTTKLSKTALNYYNTTENLEEYYNELRKNFPESYLPYLAEIHARHPNWNFVAEKINLDFDTIVENESYYGRNLLEGSAFDSNYISMGLNSYNILTDTFSDYSTEAGWYQASSEAIAFYLDPRTYLNEKYIFAFESLTYNANHNKNVISTILNQSYWQTVYNGLNSNVVDDVITATSNIGISSAHIASRIKEEIGSIEDTDMRLGGSFTLDNVTYSGYYNFFNINVWGENKLLRGMKYAMDNGWNSPYNGIYGGSKFIYDGYVGVNQDTVYYEKFDVSTSDGNYTHQYQANLAVSTQETNIAYSTYVNIDSYFDQALTFTIPVYNNMSNYAVTSPRIGNPNNYLKDIKVDGTTITGFSYDKYEYNITVPATTSTINLSATRINNDALVSGDGEISIDSDTKKVEIVVTSANKKTRSYIINIEKEEVAEEDIMKITDIMDNSGVKYNESYIFGITANTSTSSLISNISKTSSLNTISIKNVNNSNNSIFKTGDIITIGNSKETKDYTVLIYGDINSDGKIDKDDCLTILRYLKGYTSLEGVYAKAANASKDDEGKIDKDDCLAILRQIKGYTNLNE